MSPKPPSPRIRRGEHEPEPRPAPRARPVAGLPLPTLAARSDDVARRWAMALVATHPLDAIGSIPLEALAAGAPPLCKQLARALASDEELEALLDGEGPGSLASLCGSARPSAVAEAVEALRGALWEVLLEEMPHAALEPGGARLLGDVSDRLAHSSAALLAAALGGEGSEHAGRPAGPEHAGRPARPEAAASWPVIDTWAGATGRGAGTARRAEDIVPRGEAERAPSGAAPRIEEHSSDGRERPAPAPPDEPRPEPAPPEPAEGGEPSIVIVDERRPAYASIERPPFRGRVAAVGPAEVDLRRRARRGDGAGGAEVGAAAWVGPIGRGLERYERDGQPFAVLLLEARGDRSDASEAGEEALEEALAAELRDAGGTLARERPGRYWALAPVLDREGGQLVAGRLMRVIDGLARRGGAVATPAVGLAICPEDGREAAALAAQADLRLFETRPGRPA